MKIEVLDHGYVELVESWGSDQAIIESARMSTQKGFVGWGDAERSGDEKLLGYLWRNKHSTPFEFAGFVVEVQAPIFVFREWHRSRTMSYTEASARYAPLPALDYVPTMDRVLADGGANKQAGAVAGARKVDEATAKAWLRKVRSRYDQAEQDYTYALADGVPKELARILLPVGRYSKMRAQANLRNWLHFLGLRMAPNAQWEIRQYANAVASIVESLYPRTYALFSEVA